MKRRRFRIDEENSFLDITIECFVDISKPQYGNQKYCGFIEKEI